MRRKRCCHSTQERGKKGSAPAAPAQLGRNWGAAGAQGWQYGNDKWQWAACTGGKPGGGEDCWGSHCLPTLPTSVEKIAESHFCLSWVCLQGGKERELQQTLLPSATAVAAELGFICFLCWCICLFHGCSEFLGLFFLCPMETDGFSNCFSLQEKMFIRPTLCEGRASPCHIGSYRVWTNIGSEHHRELKCLSHCERE